MPGLFPAVNAAASSPEKETPKSKSSIAKAFEEAKMQTASSSPKNNGSYSSRSPIRELTHLESQNGSQSARSHHIPAPPQGPPNASSKAFTSYRRSSLRPAGMSVPDEMRIGPNSGAVGRRGSVLYIPKDSELGKVRPNETVQGWVVLDITLTQSKKLGRAGQCDPFVLISRFDHIWTKVTSCTAVC